MRWNIMGVIMGWGFCLASVGCDDAEPGATRSLVEEAEAAVGLALADYRECASGGDPGCDGEEAALVDSMTLLAEAQGDDAVTFRFASATADCAGGPSVTCSGHHCHATDNIGCMCLDELHRHLVSVATCVKAEE
jgi:hypothetical protein